MKKSNFLAITAVCAMLAPPFLSAQTSFGVPPFASTGGGPDVINLGSLNVLWSFPVVNKPGRGLPFNYNFSYNSSVWSPSGNTWLPDPNWGWSGQVQLASGYVIYKVTQSDCNIGSRYDPSLYYYDVITFTQYVDKAGTAHSLPSWIHVYDDNTCSSYGSHPNLPYSTTVWPSDGSGTSLLVTANPGATAYPTGGGSIVLPVTEAGNSGTTITDSNGNQITSANGTSFTDTLGVNALSITGSAQSGSVTYTYQSTQGAENITVAYSPYTVKTNFGCSGVTGEYGPSSQNLVSSITYPDGSSYAFHYEPTPGFSGDVTGRIAQVTLPTGGTISYGYTGGNNGIECSDGSTAGLNRSVNPGGQWTYSRSLSNSTWVTTVLDPAQEQTVINFAEDSSALTANFYETQRQVYSASGSLLLTTINCWNNNFSNCGTEAVASPISKLDHYRFLPGVANPAVSETLYNGNGLLTEDKEIDYVSAPGGTPYLRDTFISYASLGNGIVDRPSSVTVNDPSGNVATQTTYSYDQTNLSPTGAPQLAPVAGSRGNLTTVSQWLNTTNGYLSTTMTYDDAGNVLISTDPGGHQTQFSYADNFKGGQTPNAHAYVTTTTLPTTHSPGTQAHTITATYDINTGLVTDSYGQNYEHTSYTYDSMLRPLQTNFPDGGKTVVTYNYTSNALSQIWTWSYLNSTNYTDFRQHIDLMGRQDRTAYLNYQGSWDMQDTCFDANGRQGFVSYPYQDANGWGDPSVCSGTGDSFSYDALNRPTQVKHSDGTSMNYAYAGRATQVQDEGNGPYYVTRILQNDALGRLTNVCEVSGGSLLGSGGSPASCGLDYAGTGFLTSYGYDTLNDLTHVDQGGYETRTYGFDSLGRSTSESSPEQFGCTTSYSYTNDGLVYQRTRPAPNQGSCNTTVTTTYSYDEMHRLRNQTYSDGVTPPSYFNYDESNPWGWAATNPIGRLTSAWVNNVAGTATLAGDNFSTADAMGRILHNGICTPRTCGWGGYDDFYTYDNLGDVTSFNNAGLYTLTAGYNSAARLTSMTSSLVDAQHPATIVSNVSYGPVGESSDTLGNGINESFGYAARGALSSYSAGSAYSFSLGFEPDYNISSISDSVTGGWSFGYDAFNRVTSLDGGLYSWAYDRFGNRWQQNSTVGGPAPEYVMDTNNHISGSGVSYDILGNVLNDGLGHSFIYDAENRVASVNGTSYVYDTFGRRVAKQSGGSSTEEYLYDMSGEMTTILNSSGGWSYGEIYAGGRHLATYSGATTNFLHTDWLGTKRVMTSVSGGVSQSCYSLPFGDGNSCWPEAITYSGFTGDFHDNETNTEHTQFRQLSATQGRWLSPDPAGMAAADLTNPQSLNLYAYVNNNPMNAADRLGLAPCAFYLFDPDPQDGGPPPCVGGGGDGEGPDCAYDNDPLDGCIFVPIPWGGSGRGGGGGGTGPVKQPATEPNVNPSGKPPLSGETLGIPNGMSIQQRGLLAALGVPLPPDCEFGTCITIQSLIGTGAPGGMIPGVDANLALWISKFVAAFGWQTSTYLCHSANSTPKMAHCDFVCEGGSAGVSGEPAVSNQVISLPTLQKACGPITSCPRMITTETRLFFIGPIGLSFGKNVANVTQCSP